MFISGDEKAERKEEDDKDTDEYKEEESADTDNIQVDVEVHHGESIQLHRVPHCSQWNL